MSTVFNDQDNEFEKSRLTNLKSITVNGNPTTDNEITNKKYHDNSLEVGTILKFRKSVQN